MKRHATTRKLGTVRNGPPRGHGSGAALEGRFPITQLILFGSVARGEAGEDSDVELLALTSEPLPHEIRHEVYEAIASAELELNHEHLAFAINRLYYACFYR